MSAGVVAVGVVVDGALPPIGIAAPFGLDLELDGDGPARDRSDPPEALTTAVQSPALGNETSAA